MTIDDLLAEDVQQKIKSAISEAEKKTSGEIRLYIDNKCKEDVLDHAAFLFEKLEMHKTTSRNGVLFYLSVEDRKFAVIGDVGINAVVPEGFWDSIKNQMIKYFSAGNIADGLSSGILMAGNALTQYFPYQEGDINELPDDIIFGGKDV